jgi:hypothetical protein
MFTALMAGTSTAPAISLIVTFEGWVFYGMNMFTLIDSPINTVEGTTTGLYTVPVVLTLMTFTCFLYLFVTYRRMNK